jgi:uncharacterized SAM-binding protein YcdF (DUF218 family)
MPTPIRTSQRKTHSPRRRAGRRSTSPAKRRIRKSLRWPIKLALGCAALIVAFIAAGAIARAAAPKSNTGLTRFDAIIVLGTPADADGNPTPEQLARVTEGVREYERGVAPRLILTGGAAHNRFVEAQVMARTAHAEGIPDAAIVIEPKAMDTIENACYSERIMQEHGWRSAEVVSSASHLPRAALIFNRLPLAWRTHAAPSLTPGSRGEAAAAVEVLKTARYLMWASWAERCGT